MSLTITTRLAREVGASLLLLAIAPGLTATQEVVILSLGPLAATDVIDSLSLYAAGNHDKALAKIRTVLDLDFLYRTLATSGTRWINDGADGQAISHRRLIAATFALDAAFHPDTAEPIRPVRGPDRIEPRFNVERLLLAWGGAALTTRAPIFSPRDFGVVPNPGQLPIKSPDADLPVQPFERAWFLAAIALLEDRGWTGLVDNGQRFSGVPVAYPLIPLALKRFPSEPRFLLARALAEERLGKMTIGGPDLKLREIGLDLDRIEALANGDSYAQDYRLLRDALGHFETLGSATPVGAVAHLHAGYVQLLLRQRGDARKHFDAARHSLDRDVRYLSALFTGWAWERDGHVAQAETSYRDALAMVPGARSASVLLAALLFLNNREVEAAPLLDTGLIARPMAEEPWRDFPRGDASRLPELLAALRSEIR